MRPLFKKLLVAGGSALVGLGLAGWLWRERHAGSVRLYDNSESVQRLLEQRAGDGVLRSTTELVREPVSPVDAPQLWTMPPDSYEYDSFTYYRHKASLDFFEKWPEHAGGGYRMRTSPQGWREDWDVLPSPRDLFVVVAGDSHTDGLCNNDESFANVLEAGLKAQHAGKTIEVLNTGVSGYSFYNYLGVLEKLLPDKPDMFVVATYGGNDFLDLVKPWHFFHHTAPPPRSPEYWAKMTAAKSVSSESVAIAMNELLYFQYYPDQVDIALAAAEQLSAAIAQICKEHGIALVFVYIPPGFRISGKLKPIIGEAQKKLELSNADLGLYDRLADRLFERIRPLGISVIDLREQFVGDINEYYWEDLHINVKGHKLIADLLLPRVEAACAAKLK